MDNQSTPHNLEEAIRQAICVGPLAGVKNRAYHTIKDFMAQKFCAAYEEAGENKETLKILEKLFDQLTKR